MATSQPQFIWNDNHGGGRNRYVLFRFVFTLGSPAAAGSLNIFADTRYRLIVNDMLVGHGPARFNLHEPEYDAHDLLPYLKSGRNVIAVIVNSFGTVSFQADRSGGALIAWGEARDQSGMTVNIATDESWRVLESPGHRRETMALALPLGPGEFLDARRMPDGWTSPDFDDGSWLDAAIVTRPAVSGPVMSRSIPLLDERQVRPRRRLGAYVATRPLSDKIYSALAMTSSGRGPRTNARVALFAYIYSAMAQKITFGAFRGRYWVNGQAASCVNRNESGLRYDYATALKDGWNTFVVYDAVSTDCWDFYLALPRDAKLTLSASMEMECPNTFLVGGPWEDDAARDADAIRWPLRVPDDLPAWLGPWRPWQRDRWALTAGRERAWKTLALIDSGVDLEVNVPALAPKAVNATIAILYDFGAEVLGRPIIDFTAAKDTVVDLAYAERLNPDGTPAIHGGFGVDMMERYVARAGQQQWQTFHPRGFRYLEISVTGKLEKFQLHEAWVSRSAYPVQRVGEFECSDPVFNEAWAMGRNTIQTCMEDAYIDGPWRQRALRAADLYVQFCGNLAAFGDIALFRRCIALLMAGQLEDGLIPGAAHDVAVNGQPEDSAIMVLLLWQYWRRTGDADFLRQMRSGMLRLMEGLYALKIEGADLIDATQAQTPGEGAGPSQGGINCALNCFYQRALHEGARMLRLLGNQESARIWSDRASAAANAIRENFWNIQRGVFADEPVSRNAASTPTVNWTYQGMDDDLMIAPRSTSNEPSPMGNALAIFFEIASEQQADRAGHWLAGAMHGALRASAAAHCDDGITPYIAFYALGTLYKTGLTLEAEHFIRGYWGQMLDWGAGTCWESLGGDASRCHGWSSAPTHYLSQEVLGVTFPEPGNLQWVVIRPHAGSLQWASGVYPHPAGPIRVSWQIRHGRIEVKAQGPMDVKITVET